MGKYLKVKLICGLWLPDDCSPLYGSRGQDVPDIALAAVLVLPNVRSENAPDQNAE